MTPVPTSPQDIVWYVKYAWHMVISTTVTGFIMWLFREALKQWLIDKVVAKFKKGETKIEKDIKKEIKDARASESNVRPSPAAASDAVPTKSDS